MAKRTRKAAQARAKPMRRTVRTKARREPTRQSTAKRGPGRTVNASRKPVAKGGLFAGLKAYPANFAPLTPIGFVRRSAEIHPDRPAVIHGAQRVSYGELYQRTRRLASALARRGVREHGS